MLVSTNHASSNPGQKSGLDTSKDGNSITRSGDYQGPRSGFSSRGANANV